MSEKKRAFSGRDVGREQAKRSSGDVTRQGVPSAETASLGPFVTGQHEDLLLANTKNQPVATSTFAVLAFRFAGGWGCFFADFPEETRTIE